MGSGSRGPVWTARSRAAAATAWTSVRLSSGGCPARRGSARARRSTRGMTGQSLLSCLDQASRKASGLAARTAGVPRHSSTAAAAWARAGLAPPGLPVMARRACRADHGVSFSSIARAKVSMVARAGVGSSHPLTGRKPGGREARASTPLRARASPRASRGSPRIGEGGAMGREAATRASAAELMTLSRSTLPSTGTTSRREVPCATASTPFRSAAATLMESSPSPVGSSSPVNLDATLAPKATRSKSAGRGLRSPTPPAASSSAAALSGVLSANSGNV